ncbi:MAG: inosine monophosphate cyclohydrolase [Clostridiales bacterium]|nr:inosine monophosphate cyclohydrolase [Clostridiales bacterium]
MSQLQRVCDYLSGNTYPGRGVLIGRTPDGKKAAIAYFIMGRSENSRNRVFVEEEGGIRTEAFDPAKLADPSLIIYWPIRVLGDTTIVTNGDQTDTIYDFVKEGKSFEDALRTRAYEPDAPNFTPRISGILERKDGSFSYKLSILKSDEGRDGFCRRNFFEVENPPAGEGRLIHTYEGDGNPIPSFEGEPRRVTVDGDLQEWAKTIWHGLNKDNKVSLFVRFIDLATGETEDVLYNKLK